MKTKPFLLLTFFLLTLISANGQDFAPIGAEWYYSEHNGGAAPPDCEYVVYKSTKDTTILDRLAKKIERTYYRYSGDTNYLTPYYISQNHDTVFLYNPDDNDFDRLYIFNAQKGDTLTLDVPYEESSFVNQSTFRLIVDSVEIETQYSIGLKKYYIRPIDGFSWISQWYMDRIGGQDWFLPRGAIYPEAGGPLRCYHDNEVDIKLVSYDCDYRLISRIASREFDELLIYPNPTDGLFRIKTVEKIDNVEIFDSLGKLIKSTCETEINLTEFPTGTYFIKIEIDKNFVLREVFKK